MLSIPVIVSEIHLRVAKALSRPIFYIPRKESWTITFRTKDDEELTLHLDGLKLQITLPSTWTWALPQEWLKESHALQNLESLSGSDGSPERTPEKKESSGILHQLAQSAAGTSENDPVEITEEELLALWQWSADHGPYIPLARFRVELLSGNVKMFGRHLRLK